MWSCTSKYWIWIPSHGGWVDVSPLLGTINNWGVQKSERGMGLVNGEPVGRILRVSQSHDSNHFLFCWSEYRSPKNSKVLNVISLSTKQFWSLAHLERAILINVCAGGLSILGDLISVRWFHRTLRADLRVYCGQRSHHFIYPRCYNCLRAIPFSL